MGIRVVLADDQEMVRAGLRMVLQTEPDIDVVGEAADGHELLDVIARTDPDVALVDIRMPRLDGLAAAARLASDGARTHVVMLTTFEEKAYVEEALRIGVSGFVIKVSPAEQLVAAVRTAATGAVHVDPSVAKLLIAGSGARRGPAPPGLTPRETDVLRCLARGMSNAEIAEELVLGETTVKTHIARLLAKLSLRDRVQAVVWAYEHGLARPGLPGGAD
jgi:DNA-binding NarL/FixJ family response regulator